jgi:uncharacterized membrane protein
MTTVEELETEYWDDAVSEGESAGQRRRNSAFAVLREQRVLLGVGLILVGFILLVVGWADIKNIQNEAAQIPYVVSAGLGGVALVVLGGIALFGNDDAALRATTERLSGQVEALTRQVEELSETANWTADVVAQIGQHLNDSAALGQGAKNGNRTRAGAGARA